VDFDSRRVFPFFVRVFPVTDSHFSEPGYSALKLILNVHRVEAFVGPFYLNAILCVVCDDLQKFAGYEKYKSYLERYLSRIEY